MNNEQLNDLVNSAPMIIFRQACDLVGAPDVLTVLNVIDAKPDYIRERAAVLDTAAGELASFRDGISLKTATVDESWNGAASDSFARYMGRFDTFLSDVEGELRGLYDKGMELASLAQDIIDSAVDYITTKLANIGAIVGEIVALAGAGGLVASAPGAAVGALAGVVVAIIHYLTSAGEQMALIGATAGILDDTRLGTEFNETHYELGDSGTQAEDVDTDGWRPVAVG